MPHFSLTDLTWMINWPGAVVSSGRGERLRFLGAHATCWPVMCVRLEKHVQNAQKTLHIV